MSRDDAPAHRHYTDFHAYRWGDGYELHLEKFKEGSDSFSALITVIFALDPGDPEPVLVMAPRRVNLVAPTTVAQTAKTLGNKTIPTASKVSATTWEERLEGVVQLSWKAYQEGDSQLLHADEIEVDYSIPSDLITGLWAGDGVTLDYGDGEAGKSTLVLAQGLSVVTGLPVLGLRPTRQGPVGYYDWEDGERTFHERLSALCHHLGITVPHDFLYRRVDRPVGSGEMRIRREVAEEGMVAAIFDSVGEMLGGDPSDPALVIAAINAMKNVGVPALGIHHITGEQAKSKSLADKMKPYGSIYARTGARMMWLIEGFEEEDGSRTIYAHNTKSNRGERRKPLSWTVEYENDGDPPLLTSLRYSTRSASDYFDRLRADTPPEGLTIPDLALVTLERMGSWYSVAGLHARMQQDGKDCGEQSVRNALNGLVRRGLVSVRGEGRERQYLASSRLSGRAEDF